MPGERTVLVTGAGGFIGGRVVEVLHQADGLVVRPALRRWSTAARIGRLPLDPVQCDLMDALQTRTALTGVDLVIHCAVGDRDATVQGTRNLLRAALDAGIRRVVHLSTIDVYGRAEGRVDESHPLLSTGRAYGDSKIAAEAVCQEFVTAGLDVVILRPTIVYGPFSDLWTVQFAERFRDGNWLLPREMCQGRCNLVYVDDLVRAIMLALDAENVAGEAFNVSGADDVTWQEYFEALNTGLGFPPLPTPGAAASRMSSAITAPVRAAVKTLFSRFKDPILAIYKKSRVARVVMKWAERTLRRVPSSAEFDLYGRDVHFPTARAAERLGYRPAVDMAAGIDLSRQWLQHEGVVAGNPSAG
jgi:nucleoside-diphosphate-sugar epimerase